MHLVRTHAKIADILHKPYPRYGKVFDNLLTEAVVLSCLSEEAGPEPNFYAHLRRPNRKF